MEFRLLLAPRLGAGPPNPRADSNDSEHNPLLSFLKCLADDDARPLEREEIHAR